MRGLLAAVGLFLGLFSPLYAQDLASLQQQIDVHLSSGEYEKGRLLIEKLLSSDLEETQLFKARLNKSLSFFLEGRLKEALEALEKMPDIREEYLLELYKKHKAAILYKQAYETYSSLKKSSSSLEDWDQLLSQVQSLLQLCQECLSEKEVWQLHHLVLREKERIQEKEFAYLKERIQVPLQHWLQVMLAPQAEKEWRRLHLFWQADFAQAIERSQRLHELSKQETGNLWALFQDLVLEIKEALEKAKEASSLNQWRQEAGKASYLLGAFSSSLEDDSVLKALKHLMHLSYQHQELSKDYLSHLGYTRGLVEVLKRVLHRSIRSLDPEKDLHEEQQREDFFHLRYRLAALEALQPLWEKLDKEKLMSSHSPLLKEACFDYEFQSSNETQHFETLLRIFVSSDLQGIERALQSLEEKFKLRETFAKKPELLEKIKEVLLNLQEAKKNLKNPDSALAFLKGAFINWDETAYFLYLLKSHILSLSTFKDSRDSSLSWGKIQQEIRQVKGESLLGVWSYLNKLCQLMQEHLQQEPFMLSLDKWVATEALEVLKEAENPSLKSHIKRVVEKQQKALDFIEKIQGFVFQKVVLALADYIDVLFTRPEDPFPFPSGYTASLSIHSEAKQQAQQGLASLHQQQPKLAKEQETAALNLWKSLLSDPPSKGEKPQAPPLEDSKEESSATPAGESTPNASSSPKSPEEQESQKNMESNQKDSHNDQGKPYNWSKDLLEEIKQMEQEDQAILRKTKKQELKKGYKPW